MLNYVSMAELIFPTRCAGCGIHTGRLLCPECTTSLPRIHGPACRRCGKPALYEVEECLECRGRMRHLDHTMALCTYEEPLRSMIHKLKYGNGWRLARPLGAIAAVKLAPLLQSPYPLVTFVPMHRRKRRARGYDHAERLARGVAAGLGLEVIPLLERTRATNPQANLSNQARRRNVKGVFRVRTDGFDGGGDLGGREVILVDDVLTTGSTIAESAKALKKGGAGKVIACVLARDLVTGSTSPGWQESP